MPGSFGLKYEFKVNNTVVIGTIKGTLRVRPGAFGQAHGNGGDGDLARWTIELHGDLIKLKSEKTGKYLRIWKGGRDVDVQGGGGPFTTFKPHRSGDVVKLESERFAGRFIAMRRGGDCFVHSGGDSRECELKFFRKGKAHKSHLPPAPLVAGVGAGIAAGVAGSAVLGVAAGAAAFGLGKAIRKRRRRRRKVKHDDGREESISESETDSDEEDAAAAALAAEQARIDAQRAELERQRAEIAAQAEADREAAEEEAAVERARVAAEAQAAIEAQQAELEAQRAEIERQRAEMQAERERVAHEAEMARQQAELEAQRQEIERIRLETEAQAEAAAQAEADAAAAAAAEVAAAEAAAAEAAAAEVAAAEAAAAEAAAAELAKAEAAAAAAAEDDAKEDVSPEALDGEKKLIAQFLRNIGLDRYTATLFENGFETMESLQHVRESDLEKMGFKLGHVPILLNAARNARWIGKEVIIRSRNGYFVAAHKPGKKGGAYDLDAHSKLDDGSKWVVVDAGDGTIALQHKGFSTYLRLPDSGTDKECKHHTDLTKNCKLNVIPLEDGFVTLRCQSNKSYIVLKEKRLIGKFMVTSYELKKDSYLQLIE